jgi:hypothetical protein
MKKFYSLLSSLALLFSLPAIAAPLAEKAVDSKEKGKESQSKTVGDQIRAEKGASKESSSPICHGGGG